MVKFIDLSSKNWHIKRSDFYFMFRRYVYVCLVTFFAENLATFLEIFLSNQGIKPKFDRSSFLQFPISLGTLPFLNDSLGFGFYSSGLSLLLKNCASSRKISLTATYLFCSSAIFLCSIDVAKHVGQLGLCMYSNCCLHYCLYLKVFNIT